MAGFVSGFAWCTARSALFAEGGQHFVQLLYGQAEIRTVACALILGILTNVMLSKEKDEE